MDPRQEQRMMIVFSVFALSYMALIVGRLAMETFKW